MVNIRSMDLLDLNDFGPQNNKSYRFILIVIYNFSEYRWTVQLKHKSGELIKDSSENMLNSSKREPNLLRLMMEKIL